LLGCDEDARIGEIAAQAPMSSVVKSVSKSDAGESTSSSFAKALIDAFLSRSVDAAAAILGGVAPRPLPTDLAPMLAKPGRLPSAEEGWAFEVKWDGIRALVLWDGSGLSLESRNGNDITARYPELAPLGEQLGSRNAVLDGEVVAFDEQGHPSFERLQGRMHLTRGPEVTRRAKASPVSLQIFDLLHLDGTSLLTLPYSERRAALEELDLNGPTWTTPANHSGGGAELLAATAELGLEGVIAKRLSSAYRPGARSSEWLKVKNISRQELVIGGWLPQKGREATLGALLVGYFEGSAGARTLRFAGKVGTGFNRATAADLVTRLGAIGRPDSPFTDRQPQRGAHYVNPRLVCEVEFTQLTREKLLRHPSYKGLRVDKAAEDVVWEAPEDR